VGPHVGAFDRRAQAASAASYPGKLERHLRWLTRWGGESLAAKTARKRQAKLDARGKGEQTEYAKDFEPLQSASHVYWDAFTELLDDRAVGMGAVGGIAYSSITQWLDENDVEDAEERADFRWILKQLDGVFRRSISARTKEVDG
jgi:hypothetical protein